jgi:hemerythrin-like metal-binding protein
MTIAWTAELETGLRQIDLQHQELVDLINEAALAHEQGRATEMLERILPKLSGYIIFHFSTEETLLASAGVTGVHATAHRQMHHEFTDRIKQLKQASAEGNANALPELVEYLQRWLVNHIMVTDKELARLILAVPATRR